MGLDANALQPRVELTRQYVPEVKGNCEFLLGDSASELANQLVAKLRADSIIP